MCNCQRPPPHVHCKVYKVRQNKENPANRKRKEQTIAAAPPSDLKDIPFPNNSIPISPSIPIPPSYPKPVEMVKPVLTELDSAVPRIPSLPIMDTGILPSNHEDSSKPPSDVSHFDSMQCWSDTQNVWNFPSADIPGIQNSDWLTQLNLTILDSTQPTNPLSQSILSPSSAITSPKQSLAETLRMYFETYGDPTDFTRCSLEKQILERASVAQVKAGKCDLLFRMLDTFNQNSIHVTVTWYLMHNNSENCIKGNVFPGLYAILKHYPSILFTLGSTTDYSDNAETLPRGKITITFLNTSTVIGVKPLCTSVALMDNCFRRFAEVEVREAWSRGNQTWTAIGNIDTKKLKEMIAFGEEAERVLAAATNPCRICVRMNLQNDQNYFEKLPLLSLILKRVVSEYPGVVFTLYRMSCQNRLVNCVVEFSETKDWVSIINSYEANIVVFEYKEEDLDPSSAPLLLDL